MTKKYYFIIVWIEGNKLIIVCEKLVYCTSAKTEGMKHCRIFDQP